MHQAKLALHHCPRSRIRPKRRQITLRGRARIALWDRVSERDKWRCRGCGKSDTLSHHHIVFRSHGGDDADYNLLLLCMECHDGIHGKLINTRGVLVIQDMRDPDAVVNANNGLAFIWIKEST